MVGARTRAIFDTNILIDYLAQHPAAIEEIGRFPSRAVSIVTWMEVLVGVDPQHSAQVRLVLDEFELLQLSPQAAEAAIVLRRQLRLKLPDAMVLGTAITEGRLLITRNTRDFRERDGVVRIPYQI